MIRNSRVPEISYEGLSGKINIDVVTAGIAS